MNEPTVLAWVKKEKVTPVPEPRLTRFSMPERETMVFQPREEIRDAGSYRQQEPEYEWCYAPCECERNCCDLPLSSVFAQVSYHMGESLFADDNYTRAGLYYVPNLCCCPFGIVGQSETFFINDGDWANSTGLGIRMMDPCLHWIWGVNAFHDYRAVEIGSLHQASIGFELITPCFDFRVNGYIPVGTSSIFGTPFEYAYPNSDFSVIITPEAYLYRGWDFVFGKYFCLPCNFFAYGAVGGYHLDDNADDSAWGFQTRGEIWWSSFLFGGVYYTYDHIFGSKTEGYFGVSVPLDNLCAWFSLCRNRCCDCYCDPGSYCNGYNGRAARIPHLGGGPGVTGQCCNYQPINF